MVQAKIKEARVMNCKIEGCDKQIQYHKRQICQMHYFRFMRNGQYEKLEPEEHKKVRKYGVGITKNTAGYISIKGEGHPLQMANGFVYQHRKVIYEVYGENLPNCQKCKTEIDWGNCHIDHINCDVSDNRRENLRPLCRACNTGRAVKSRVMKDVFSKYVISFDGEEKTAREWAKDERVSIPYHTIIQRVKRGLSNFDCLFMPLKTHNGKSK